MNRLAEEWEAIAGEAVMWEEVSGAGILLMKDGEEAVRISCGFADREKQTVLTDKTIYRLYSMTKPITAAAAMLLTESHDLNLSAPVGEYLPEFSDAMVWCGDHAEPARRPILVEDLLMMTSGLTYGDEDTVTETAVRTLFQETERRLYTARPVTTGEFVRRAAEIPLLFHPGESWKYGISADILGAVIEAAAVWTGRPLLSPEEPDWCLP